MRLLKTFSTKVLLLLTLVTCAVAMGSAWSVYSVARAHQIERVKQKLMMLATTSAAFVDGDLLATLTEPEQHGSPAWKQIAEALLKVRDSDPEIKFIYTMAKRPDTEETGILQFVVDPVADNDENGNGVIDPEEENAALGEAYNAQEDAPDMLVGFEKVTCDQEMTVDQWGACLSGYAPIRDSKGSVVGIVDKLLGDGIMVLFGAPLDMTNYEEQAVKCALAMREALPGIRKASGIADLALGIGINTGWTVAGNIGSGKIMDYTVIGDPVNVASRLEQSTKELGVDIVISQSTAEGLTGDIALVAMGSVALRGREEPMTVYSIPAKDASSPDDTPSESAEELPELAVL